jgi:uncharacterized membrane protein YfcA
MAMFSWDVFPLTALLAAGAGFLVGGVSKGAFGVGLPLLALPIMVNFMPVSQAMALLTVPSIVTNVWQALHGTISERFSNVSGFLASLWRLVSTLAR